jgi:hypothetical protein
MCQYSTALCSEWSGHGLSLWRWRPGAKDSGAQPLLLTSLPGRLMG